MNEKGWKSEMAKWWKGEVVKGWKSEVVKEWSGERVKWWNGGDVWIWLWQGRFSNTIKIRYEFATLSFAQKNTKIVLPRWYFNPEGVA